MSKLMRKAMFIPLIVLVLSFAIAFTASLETVSASATDSAEQENIETDLAAYLTNQLAEQGESDVELPTSTTIKID